MKKSIITGLAVLSLINTSNGQNIADFEDLSLATDTFWNGSSDPLGTYFTSGEFEFYNHYDTSFGGFWSEGWVYSSKQDSTTVGVTNLYGAVTASGYNNSNAYAVGTQGSIVRLNTDNQGEVLAGFYVTNGTYAALSMRDGDSFAKKFGGADGNDPDYFKLTIKNWFNGSLSSDSVEFYLADFRDSDNSQDYIVRDWQWVDLHSLGATDSLEFSLSSSDVGQFGMNTPAYFCIDELQISTSVGISEEISSVSVQAFPNPVKDNLTVVYNTASENVNLNLLDSQGRLVLSERLNSMTSQIDMSDLKSGMYLLQVIDNNKTEVLRILVK